MAFSEFSSGVTTQTSTDAGLSGMSGLSATGFVYLASGARRLVTMNHSGAGMNVSGSLTINAATDLIWFSQAGRNLSINVLSGGTLTLDNTDGGVTRQAYGVYSAKVGATHWNPSDSVINVNGGGTLRLQGSGVVAQTPLNISGTFFARNSVVKSGQSSGGITCMFRYTGSPTIDIIGLTLIDMSYVQDATPASVVNLSGLNIAMPGLGGTNNVAMMFRSALTLLNPQFSGNVNTHLACTLGSTSAAPRILVYGWESGLAPLIGKVPDFGSSTAWYEGRKIINLTVRNTAGIAQQGVRGRFTDVNNGARYNGGVVSATNFQSDITYDATSNASGLLTVDVLLWEVAGQIIGVSNVNINAAVDYRWSVNGPTYNITIPLKSYANLPSSITVDCNGFGQAVAATAFVTTDASVTRSEAAAAALTTIETLDDIYDAAKNWSIQSVNTNYPTQTTQPVNAIGSQADSGNISLVVDATAAAAFAVNTGTNTITVKSTTLTAGVKFTSLKTTGNITAVNGAAIAVPYEDANGVRATIAGLDPASLGTTWVLGYITTANYDARTPANAHATWTGWAQTSGTGNSTQLTLAAATEYKLFLRIPGYFAPIGPIATINTATQSSVTLSPVVDVDITGALLWPQTAAHTTQAGKFSYNMTDQLVEYDNTTGSAEYISFLAAYRALETIAKAPAMAYQLIQPLYLNGTRDGFALPRNNPLLARMTAASTAGAILQADISYADNQAAAFDRFRANSEHPHLLIPQASATVNASTIQAIQAGLATRAELVVVNNGVKKASNFMPHKADLPA